MCPIKFWVLKALETLLRWKQYRNFREFVKGFIALVRYDFNNVSWVTYIRPIAYDFELIKLGLNLIIQKERKPIIPFPKNKQLVEKINPGIKYKNINKLS